MECVFWVWGWLFFFILAVRQPNNDLHGSKSSRYIVFTLAPAPTQLLPIPYSLIPQKMKYRRLKDDELSELEAEFVRFLAANTVTAQDWEQYKKESPEQAQGLIDLFSDIVFEKVLSNVNYLEYKSPKDIKTFHFGEEKAVMLGLKLEGETSIDFTQAADPANLVTEWLKSGAQLQLYSAEKVYKEERPMEIFRLLEAGAKISKDGAMFKTLERLRQERQD